MCGGRGLPLKRLAEGREVRRHWQARVATVGLDGLRQGTAGGADGRDLVEQVDVGGFQVVVVGGDEAPVVPGKRLDAVEAGQVAYDVALDLPHAGQVGGAGADAVQLAVACPALLPCLAADEERVAGHVQRVDVGVGVRAVGGAGDLRVDQAPAAVLVADLDYPVRSLNRCRLVPGSVDRL